MTADKANVKWIITDFNPHSHEGSDGCIYVFCFFGSISIHTPTKGVTLAAVNPSIVRKISIHTPTKGVTFDMPLLCLYAYNFNPHSHEGSDYLRSLLKYSNRISIHTPTKGVTAILTNNFLIFCSISLINFILYLKIIQILFIFRYKFIFYFIF